eukprot:365247-Chlamydomonas_euryale.AAC.13
MQKCGRPRTSTPQSASLAMKLRRETGARVAGVGEACRCACGDGVRSYRHNLASTQPPLTFARRVGLPSQSSGASRASRTGGVLSRPVAFGPTRRVVLARAEGDSVSNTGLLHHSLNSSCARRWRGGRGSVGYAGQSVAWLRGGRVVVRVVISFSRRTCGDAACWARSAPAPSHMR